MYRTGKILGDIGSIGLSIAISILLSVSQLLLLNFFALQKASADSAYPELVSMNNNGEPAADFIPGGCGPSGDTLSMSADARYVLFCSSALNLNPQRTDQNSNPLYVRDRVNNQTTLVSVNSQGVQENGYLVGGEISGDGRHVIFVTDATNIDSRVLSSPEGINRFNTYVRDLDEETTTLVSEDSQGNLISAGQGSSISFNGDTVLFTGNTTLPIPTLENRNTYVRRISTNETHMITQGNVGGEISADGNYVLFDKPIPPNHHQVARYSVNNQTTETFFGMDAANTKGISENGRYIVVADRDGSVSGSTSLCPPSFCLRIVRYDTLTTTVALVDVKDDGSDPDSWYGGGFSSMSADGRFVAFYGNGLAGLSNDSFGHQGLFVRDLTQGNTVLVSKNGAGQPINDVASSSWFANSETEFIAYPNAGATNSGFPSRQILLTKVYAEYNQTDIHGPEIGQVSWSLNPKTTNDISDLTASATDDLSGLQMAEYFLGDNDPGQGNGTPMQLTNIQNGGLSADLTAAFGTDLPAGVYEVNIRAVDNAGNWSTITTTELVVEGSDVTPPLVSNLDANYLMWRLLPSTRAFTVEAFDEDSGVAGGEFYIDTDPGDGNGTPLTLNGSTLSGTVPANTPFGLHQLHVRAVDNAGNWSQPISQWFFIGFF